MPTISIRISDEEKKVLIRYGKVSKTVREAIRQYLNTKKSRTLLGKLEELQRQNVVKTTTPQEVELLKGDRRR